MRKFRPATDPAGAVRVRAVLDEEDPLGAAELRDRLDLEGDVPADVHDDGRPRPVARDLRLEVGERHAEIFAIAIDELHLGTRVQCGQRGRHERV
jgi:hypothetical protein